MNKHEFFKDDVWEQWLAHSKEKGCEDYDSSDPYSICCRECDQNENPMEYSDPLCFYSEDDEDYDFYLSGVDYDWRTKTFATEEARKQAETHRARDKDHWEKFFEEPHLEVLTPTFMDPYPYYDDGDAEMLWEMAADEQLKDEQHMSILKNFAANLKIPLDVLVGRISLYPKDGPSEKDKEFYLWATAAIKYLEDYHKLELSKNYENFIFDPFDDEPDEETVRIMSGKTKKVMEENE